MVNARREVSFKKHGSGYQQPKWKSNFQAKYQFSAFFGSKLCISARKIKFTFHVLNELKPKFGEISSIYILVYFTKYCGGTFFSVSKIFLLTFFKKRSTNFTMNLATWIKLLLGSCMSSKSFSNFTYNFLWRWSFCIVYWFLCDKRSRYFSLLMRLEAGKNQRGHPYFFSLEIK